MGPHSVELMPLCVRVDKYEGARRICPRVYRMPSVSSRVQPPTLSPCYAVCMLQEGVVPLLSCLVFDCEDPQNNVCVYVVNRVCRVEDDF